MDFLEHSHLPALSCSFAPIMRSRASWVSLLTGLPLDWMAPPHSRMSWKTQFVSFFSVRSPVAIPPSLQWPTLWQAVLSLCVVCTSPECHQDWNWGFRRYERMEAWLRGETWILGILKVRQTLGRPLELRRSFPGSVLSALSWALLSNKCPFQSCIAFSHKGESVLHRFCITFVLLLLFKWRNKDGILDCLLHIFSIFLPNRRKGTHQGTFYSQLLF